MLDFKKEIVKNWMSRYPMLISYTSKRLYMTLDITIVGLLFLKDSDSLYYRAVFEVYPLWKENRNANLDSPIIYQEILDKKNRRLYIPCDKHNQYIEESLQCAQDQVGTCLQAEVCLSSMISLIDKYYLNDGFAQCNPARQAELFELKLYLIQYVGDFDLMSKVLKDMEKVSKKWKQEYFYEDCTIADWKRKLFDNLDHWPEMMRRIEMNMLDKKISRLKKGHLIY